MMYNSIINIISPILKKSKWINTRFFYFMLAGSFNTILGYYIYILLLKVISYKAAYTLAFLGGVIISYITNNLFVFKTKALLNVKNITAYPFVYIFQYILGSILLFFFIESLRICETNAIILVTAVTFPMTYFFSKLILAR